MATSTDGSNMTRAEVEEFFQAVLRNVPVAEADWRTINTVRDMALRGYDGPKCPFPWTGDNGTIKDCIVKGHCGCVYGIDATREHK